ncbi:MAG: hypothetical protein CSA83_00935 [Actinomycetales bacterium]|nr:MAG: hypothetical protein CSA83_00935 [Actinomycetales bacterium]
MNLAEIIVAFNHEPLRRVHRRAMVALIYRSVSAVISFAICIAIDYYLGDQLSTWLRWIMYGTWAVSTFVWLAISIFAFLNTRRALKKISPGPALYFSPLGIEINKVQYRWEDISKIWAKPALSSIGPMLVVQTVDGGWQEIAFLSLDSSIGELDSIIRSYGHPGIDLAPLDQLG